MRKRIALLAGVSSIALLAAALPASAAQTPGVSLSVEDAKPGPVIRAIPQPAVDDRRFAAAANEHFELLFLDGTSLTLAPGSAVTVQRYRYDAQSKTGELSLRFEDGLFRIAGGTLNRTSPITGARGTCTLAITDASAVVGADAAGGLRTYLLAGKGAALASGAGSEASTLQRPIFQTTSECGADGPSEPERLDQAQVEQDAFALNPRLVPGGFVTAAGAQAEEEATTPPQVAGIDDDINRIDLQVTTTPPTPPVRRVQASLDRAGGYGAGPALTAGNFNGETGSIVDSTGDAGYQDADIRVSNDGNTVTFTVRKFQGQTSNRLFTGGAGLSQTLSDPARRPTEVSEASGPTGLTYAFTDANTLYLRHPRTLDLQQLTPPLLSETVDLTSVDPSSRFLVGDSIGISFTASDPAENRVLRIETKPRDSDNPLTIFPESEVRHFKVGFIAYALSTPLRDTSNLVLRNPDNFLIMQVKPTAATVPNSGEVFVFAAGDVDGTDTNGDGIADVSFQPQFSVDRFFLSPGLEGAQTKVALEGTGQPEGTIEAGIRAFLRNETTFEQRDATTGQVTRAGIPLTDSGLLVVNRDKPGVEPGQRGGDLIGQILHADYGSEPDGAGGERSTLSITVGGLERYGDATNGFDVAVDAQTLGSTRDSRLAAANGIQPGSTLLVSPLFATAAGGGNPSLPGAGRVGYLVLENFDLKNGTGGDERPLGNDTQAQGYAVLRLATGIGSLPAATAADDRSPATVNTLDRSAATYQGHAAGLSEFQNAGRIDVALVDGFNSQTGETAGNLVITTDPARNLAQANLSFEGAAGVSQTFTLGPDGLTSAFVDADTFGMRTRTGDPAGSVAMVTGNLVTSECAGGRCLAGSSTPIPNYKYLQWGVFLGDRNLNASEREHIHTGSWVAGNVLDQRNESWSGEATYKGHTLGNVFDNGNLRTAVGEFENKWNFGARSGNATLKFDNGVYGGASQFKAGRGFGGDLTEAGGRNRVGRLDGDFFGVSGRPQPDAVGGQFQVQSRDLNRDAYIGKGTFAGEKAP